MGVSITKSIIFPKAGYFVRLIELIKSDVCHKCISKNIQINLPMFSDCIHAFKLRILLSFNNTSETLTLISGIFFVEYE